MGKFHSEDSEGVQRGQLAGEAEGDNVYYDSRTPNEAMAAARGLSDELTAIIELRGDVRAHEGRALEEVINSLSKTVKAQYKPAALYRGMGPRSANMNHRKSSLTSTSDQMIPRSSASTPDMGLPRR